MAAEGKYVVIEGNDGTGKSTQVELLAEWLKAEKGVESFQTHEPAGTPVADAIRTVIKNGDLTRDAKTNLLLFTAARHEIWQRASRELALGRWVISARNYLSTEVYQGIAEGLPLAMIHSLTRQFTDERYMTPDHTVVLTLDDATRQQRIAGRGSLENQDTFESRGDDFQAKLNAGYREVAERYGLRTIDASQSIDEIQAEIRQIVSG